MGLIKKLTCKTRENKDIVISVFEDTVVKFSFTNPEEDKWFFNAYEDPNSGEDNFQVTLMPLYVQRKRCAYTELIDGHTDQRGKGIPEVLFPFLFEYTGLEIYSSIRRRQKQAAVDMWERLIEKGIAGHDPELGRYFVTSNAPDTF